MTKYILRLCLLVTVLVQLNTSCQAQLSPINFETNGYGSTWTWTTFENASNPAPIVMANPVPGGINTSDNVIQFTALQAGQPWAGFESLHGSGIGTFTLDTTNSIIKVMVYKSVISDVGVKLVTPSSASTGELKVANTLINQWEELTFDFTSQIGHPAMIGIDQIVIFPDFDLAGRTGDNVCYIDNIITGASSSPINVTFQVQSTDSLPVYVFGDWNNWSNFPGAPMTLNASGNYEATVSLPPNRAIEYQFVNGVSTQEVLNSNDPCTNGNMQFTNRLTNLGASDTTICNIWETCSSCVPLSTNELSIQDVEIRLTTNYLQVRTNDFQTIDEIEIVDMLGKTIFSSTKQTKTNQRIEVALNNNQLYIIKIKAKDSEFTSKHFIL